MSKFIIRNKISIILNFIIIFNHLYGWSFNDTQNIIVDSLGTGDIKFSKLSDNDSIDVSIYKEKTFKSNQYKLQPAAIIASAAMVGVAITGLYIDEFQNLNHTVQDGMSGIRKRKLHFDDYIQYVPIITYVGFGSIGIRSRYDLKRRLAAGLTSYATMGILVNAAKYSFRVKRPDASTRNSFPSGHTAMVFTGAELMRIEYGNLIGAAAYALAATVGFMRMYNDRHWFTDVMAGAGIGVLSAHVGYWILPVWEKLFKWNSNPTNKAMSSIIPCYDHESRNLSINFAMLF